MITHGWCIGLFSFSREVRQLSPSSPFSGRRREVRSDERGGEGKEEDDVVCVDAHEAYGEPFGPNARRNTERNARAASHSLPSLAATKRHYPRLDTLATLSVLSPYGSPFPPCRSTPSSSRFFFLFRVNSFTLSLSISLSLAPSRPSRSRLREIFRLSPTRLDLCT